MGLGIGSEQSVANNALIAVGNAQSLANGVSIAEVDDNQLQQHYGGHSRYRVYPRTTNVQLAVVPGIVADTWGPWTAAVPVNTIGMPYHVKGFIPEFATNVGNPARNLMFQFASAVAPENMEILGEVRFRIDTAVWVVTVGALYVLQMFHLDINAGVWIRAMSSQAATASLEFSLAINQHYPLAGGNGETDENWPWP